ncbi:MAG: 50S ribosomal protein L10 [Nanoarchaeota archaeon]|nr:50S ribosomal protein L10 [Nanoarchaeota archaeon]MBU1321751.1 50S ribosomal protein L10 [Nanoarchaeota archaeon]MBU1597475.1 50S ribosomal protein L10 [Nanoarchaeota archaeon]MBU2441413.1 50S ribosomal protein L10 [Nanoarchaeota archaeon]
MVDVEVIKEGEPVKETKKPLAKPAAAKNKGRQGVPDNKKKLVKRMVDLIDKNSIVGVVNMRGLPSKQLTNMRSQLRANVTLVMVKKRFIKLALEASKKPGIKKLEEYVKGMPALLFTDQNPFALYKLIKKNKSTASIKGGQTAPNDIIVPAGPTGFSPGPVIGELGSFKIKAGIDAGKVVIKEDSLVAHEGDEVSTKLAGLLTRLGIEPMEIGLNVLAVFENGEILDKKILDIDEEEYINNIKSAASESFNLAMFIALPIKDTIELLLSKAHSEARAVAKEANIMTSDNVGEVLAKAEAQANALKAKVPDAPAVAKEEKKEEVKEEKQTEEKKEEPKAESKAEEKKEEVKEEKKETQSVSGETKK